MLDNCSKCNGDGQVQRGEEVELLIDVTNIGTGKALDSFASIKNGADSNIFIEKGRFKLGELAPGETRSARFQLEVKKGYQGADFPLKLAIIDEPLEEFTAEKLVVPVSDKGTAGRREEGLRRRESEGAAVRLPVGAGQDARLAPEGRLVQGRRRRR